MITIILLTFIIASLAIYLYLIFTQNSNNDSDKNLSNIFNKDITKKNKFNQSCTYPSIKETTFKTGYLQDPHPIHANICGTSIIKQPYVDYEYQNTHTNNNCCSENCDNLIFNSPP
jgi:hypothetical protein